MKEKTDIAQVIEEEIKQISRRDEAYMQIDKLYTGLKGTVLQAVDPRVKFNEWINGLLKLEEVTKSNDPHAREIVKLLQSEENRVALFQSLLLRNSKTKIPNLHSFINYLKSELHLDNQKISEIKNIINRGYDLTRTNEMRTLHQDFNSIMDIVKAAAPSGEKKNNFLLESERKYLEQVFISGIVELQQQKLQEDNKLLKRNIEGAAFSLTAGDFRDRVNELNQRIKKLSENIVKLKSGENISDVLAKIEEYEDVKKSIMAENQLHLMKLEKRVNEKQDEIADIEKKARNNRKQEYQWSSSHAENEIKILELEIIKLKNQGYEDNSVKITQMKIDIQQKLLKLHESSLSFHQQDAKYFSTRREYVDEKISKLTFDELAEKINETEKNLNHEHQEKPIVNTADAIKRVQALEKAKSGLETTMKDKPSGFRYFLHNFFRQSVVEKYETNKKQLDQLGKDLSKIKSHLEFKVASIYLGEKENISHEISHKNVHIQMQQANIQTTKSKIAEIQKLLSPEQRQEEHKEEQLERKTHSKKF